MTPDEFKQFCRLLCGEKTATDEGGYYPSMPFNGRFASQWYRQLQRYSLAQCLRALEVHVAAYHDRHPTLDTLIERIKALQPPPIQPWQQFPPAQVSAMRDQGYGGVLRSLLPPQQGNPWAKCWIWLFEQGFAKPGRERELAAECRKLADEYPYDRQDWLREAARIEREAREKPPCRTPAQVSTVREPVPQMGQNDDEEVF